MNKTLTSGSLLLTAALLSLTATAPATAATARVDDPQDLAHGVDLRSVAVRNTTDRVVVTTTHTNLRRGPATGSGGAVYVDTDRTDRGPELVLVGGYFDGTDYQLLHTDGFGRHAWGRPVAGNYRMRIDYRRDTVRTVISRSVLDDAGAVRVAVRVSGTRSDGTSAGVDWLGASRSFTPWVARD